MALNSGLLLYPQRGIAPEVQSSLEFLPPEITEACVCVGAVSQGSLWTRWLGRNFDRPVQFWSATKIIPLLNVAVQVAQVSGDRRPSPLHCCIIRPQGGGSSIPFLEAARNIVGYRCEWRPGRSSNALAAVLKRFETYEGLERWVQALTGSDRLEFRGNYGLLPSIPFPELVDPITQTVLLKATPCTPKGQNLVSAYDLTRLMSMLGWHSDLPLECRLPAVNRELLQPILRSRTEDPARYADRALRALRAKAGPQLRQPPEIHSVRVLSKVGYGPSEERQTDELTYTAFVQFTGLKGFSPSAQALAFTLRAVLPNHGRPNCQQRSLDQLMTRAVAELLHQTCFDLPG